MPIYFHVQSHIWIWCLFIANGLLMTWLLRWRFESFRAWTSPLESQILSGFFISISINGLILLALDSLSLSFSLAKWPLAILAIALLLTVIVFVAKLKANHAFRFEIGFLRLILYTFVFVVLFYNGALIEQLTDAWWHMSLANKISLESTFNPTFGHLTGLPTRYYPPLWHGNLALAKELSGVSIPVYWNSLTAWIGMFKVMAFYLFAYGLSKDKGLALIAAILFVLLPGVGVSYLRVSAWPSHVAYTAWFVMFYVVALMFDDLPKSDRSLKQGVVSLLSASTSKLATLLVLSALIFFTHKSEILWFVIAWFSYCVAASLSRSLSSSDDFIVDRDHILIRYVYRSGLLILVAYMLWFAINQAYLISGLSDQLLANILPIALLLTLFALDFQFKSKVVSYGFFLVLCILIFGSVNYTHFYSLFVPELAMPQGQFHESSAVAIGYLGGELKVPGWHLQLRSGLLYSGVLSIVVAIVALAFRPSRLTILMAGTGFLALLFCSSPYLYHWLQNTLNYHSPWRVSLMIFHPIIWAFALMVLNPFNREQGGG